MWHRQNRSFLLLTLLVVMTCTSFVMAQVPSGETVIDWTEVVATPEMIVEALLPDGEAPIYGSRSLSMPSCARFHRQQSRGIRPMAVSDYVAISVEFESDSAVLTEAARQTLDRLGRALRNPALANCCFRVEGHTDSQHTDAHNQRLSEARARNAMEYLVEHFELEPDQLLLEGWGEQRPLARNDTPEGRQKNRRVQVTNLGFRSGEGGS